MWTEEGLWPSSSAGRHFVVADIETGTIRLGVSGGRRRLVFCILDLFCGRTQEGGLERCDSASAKTELRRVALDTWTACGGSSGCFTPHISCHGV